MPEQVNLADLTRVTAQVRGGLTEASWLWDLLIQNPIFQQLAGGGHTPVTEDATAALIVTRQLKTVVEGLVTTMGSLEDVLTKS
jgi:hypothetical protein